MPTYPTAAFPMSRAAFEAVVTELSADSSERLEHADLERLLLERSTELVRCLEQDYLDVRAARERAAPPEPMRGADGAERTEYRPSQRTLGSLFGTVLVHRLALVKHGVEGGLRPLDAHLNLPEGLYSHGVQREIAWSVAQVSFEAAVENVRRMTGATIAKRQAEELVVNYTADFQDFYAAQPRVKDTSDMLLVLTFDGSGVVMRPEGLRPETRKKAEKSRRKSAAEASADVRRSPDEPNRKRMAEVAAVYSLQVSSRTPEDVMRELRRTGARQKRPRAQNKRVWASLERPIIEVVDDAFYEAVQRDEVMERRWVALVDGNLDQIDAVERAAAQYGVKITIVADFIHVLGYLWKAGKALHEGAKVDAIEAWVTERAERVLRGQVSLVAAGIRRSATRRGLTGAPRKAADKCANYLLNHKAHLRYHEYLRDGLPIATGVIEGACRSLVKDRMDITGARWGLQGGEAVLKLRSLRASGDFDDYVKFHERRELERNHLQQYDQHELIELREAA
jgi:hypothetical protein